MDRVRRALPARAADPGDPAVRAGQLPDQPPTTRPTGRVLCAEIPCALGDAGVDRRRDDLAELVRDGLRASGLPGVRLGAVVVRRLPHVYPVYELGYATRLAAAGRVGRRARPGVTTFGRLGLFAHDNTHHAIARPTTRSPRCARTAPAIPGSGPPPAPGSPSTSSRTDTRRSAPVHGRDHLAQVAAEPDERGAGGAEARR